jgi:hypothetical protein
MVKLKGTPQEIMKSLADWAEGLSPEEKAELRKGLNERR